MAWGSGQGNFVAQEQGQVSDGGRPMPYLAGGITQPFSQPAKAPLRDRAAASRRVAPGHPAEFNIPRVSTPAP